MVLALTVVPNATVIPSEAVQTGQQGQYVFVVKPDESVEVRTITTGQIRGDEIVIEKGVKPGEVVVTDGQLRLAPGSKVQFKEASGAKGTRAGVDGTTGSATMTSATAERRGGAGDRS